MNDVKKYIAGMDGIATIPVLLAKIVRTCNDPKAGPRDIINLVTYDPALAERILRVANSVFFGHSGQVGNLYQAVMLLGLERIKSLALGLTLMNSLPGRGATTATHVWIHSYEVAFVASSFANYIPGLLSGDCFLAGLLHDVGRIVFLGMDPDRSGQLEASDDLMDRERALFGCAHTAAGALLADTIGIPEELMAPIQFHHTPLEAEQSRDLVASVALAEALIGLRKSRPEEDGVWNRDHDALVKQFKIGAQALDAVYDDLVDARGEIEGIFSWA